MKRPMGFTIIELITTLTIMSFVLVMGVPQFQNTVHSNRLSTQVNAIVGFMVYARSEAVKRGGNVLVCPRAEDQEQCSTEWKNGFAAYADTDGDGKIGGVDVVLRVSELTIGDNTLVEVDPVTLDDASKGKFGFTPRGELLQEKPGELVRFGLKLCDGFMKSYRLISISTVGQVRSISKSPC